MSTAELKKWMNFDTFTWRGIYVVVLDYASFIYVLNLYVSQLRGTKFELVLLIRCKSIIK